MSLVSYEKEEVSLQDEFSKDRYSAEIRVVMEERVRRIYFGVLCEMNAYRNDERFSRLEMEMKSKKLLLRNAVKRSHNI